MAHEKVHVICENLCLEEGMTKGQIVERFATKQAVEALASGSPKGVYTNSAAIKTANPETGVYIATGNGHIYSWTKDSTGNPIDLGVYQATELSEKSVDFMKLEEDLQNYIKYTSDLSSNAITIGQRYSTTDGSMVLNNPDRARTGRMSAAYKNIKYIYCDSNVYDISVLFFNSTEGTTQDAFIQGSPTGWLEGKIYKIPSEYPFMAMSIKRYDGADITSSDVPAIKTAVKKVTYNLDTTLTEEGKIPDSKTIGDRLANIENKLPYQSGFIHFNVNVNSNINSDNSSDEYVEEEVKCVLMLPENYSNIGNKIPLIAMFHGASGTVTDTVWYNNNWMGLVNYYLSQGFAVFDTNRRNESVNAFGKTYGSPVAIEAMKKAFNYINKNYNVEDKIFVHGTSMGGATAQAFAYAYPNLVKAVTCFAPANNIYSLWRNSSGIRPESTANEIAQCLGYETRAAAKADDYKKIVGYSTGLRIRRFNKTTGAFIKSNVVDIENSLEQLEDGFWHHTNEDWLLDFPVPIKIWIGTSDTQVENTFSKCVIEAIRNAGGIGYIKEVNGADHTAMSYGQLENAKEEAVMFYNRFK